jgi:CPA2 family monovalent cation:H+ antiporter-2
LILGYLLAGIVLGPLITSLEVENSDLSVREIVDLLASLGIVLLTFSIGLEFSFKQLRRIGIPVIFAAMIEIAVMIVVGFQVGLAIGWTKLEATLLGAVLSVASTMIIVRALRESGGLTSERARLVVGLLVVEDFAAVLILAAVSGLISTGLPDPQELTELILKMGAFVVTSIAIGITVVPRLVDYVGRQRSNELLVVTVLGLAFSMAYFAKWIGFSEAIGAFVMGVIISESKYLGEVVRRIEPVRDLFGAMFFITVGMLVDLSLLNLDLLWIVLLITGVFVFAKLFSTTLSTFLMGFGARNSVSAGLGMLAIGEFSLMIAAIAGVGADPSQASFYARFYAIVVLVTTLTALIVPYSIRYTDKSVKFLEERTPRRVVYFVTYINLLFRNTRRRSRSSPHMSNEMRNTVTTLALYFVIMTTAVVFAVSAAPYVDQYAYLLGGNSDWLLGTLLAGSLVVVFFGVIGIWRKTVRIIEIATSEAMLNTKSAENIGYHATAKSLKWAFLGFYSIVGLVIVSPIMRSIVQQDIVFGAFIISIIAVAVSALWGSAKTIDTKLSEILNEREGVYSASASSDLAEIEDIIAEMERGRR